MKGPSLHGGLLAASITDPIPFCQSLYGHFVPQCAEKVTILMVFALLNIP